MLEAKISQAVRRDRIPTGRKPGRRSRPISIPRRATERLVVYAAWAQEACHAVGRSQCLARCLPNGTAEVKLIITGETGREVWRDLDKVTQEVELREAVVSLLQELPSKVLFPGPAPFRDPRSV